MDPIALLRGSRELSTPIGPIETDARMPTENRDVRGTLVCNGLEIPSEASVEVISDIILCVQHRAFSRAAQPRNPLVERRGADLDDENLVKMASSGPKIEPFKMATRCTLVRSSASNLECMQPDLGFERLQLYE